MACQNCRKIRAAILHGRMAEAAGLTVEKLRETIGFKTEGTATAAAVEAGAEPVVPEPKKAK